MKDRKDHKEEGLFTCLYHWLKGKFSYVEDVKWASFIVSKHTDLMVFATVQHI